MKGVVDASTIDISNVVFMAVSNPYYPGEEINVMEFAFKYPEEKIHMIEVIKLVVRCGLQLKYHSYSDKAIKWLGEYYQ